MKCYRIDLERGDKTKRVVRWYQSKEDIRQAKDFKNWKIISIEELDTDALFKTIDAEQRKENE